MNFEDIEDKDGTYIHPVTEIGALMLHYRRQVLLERVAF